MSKERLLLVGAGGFGRVVSELARQSFDCAFVDDGVEVGTIICDIPVIGQTADLHNLFAEYKNLVIVIGNNSVRERIYNMAKRIGYNFPNLISSSAYISSYCFFMIFTLKTIMIQKNYEMYYRNVNMENGYTWNIEN